MYSVQLHAVHVCLFLCLSFSMCMYSVCVHTCIWFILKVELCPVHVFNFKHVDRFRNKNPFQNAKASIHPNKCNISVLCCRFVHFSMKFVEIIATNVYKLTKCVFQTPKLLWCLIIRVLVYQMPSPFTSARIKTLEPQIQLKFQGFDPLTRAHTLANQSFPLSHHRFVHRASQINVLVSIFNCILWGGNKTTKTILFFVFHFNRNWILKLMFFPCRKM